MDTLYSFVIGRDKNKAFVPAFQYQIRRRDVPGRQRAGAWRQTKPTRRPQACAAAGEREAEGKDTKTGARGGGAAHTEVCSRTTRCSTLADSDANRMRPEIERYRPAEGHSAAS